MSRRLLFEIGVEELPASFLATALSALPGLADKALDEARLAHGEVRALGSPRRLALIVEDLAPRQSDVSELVIGPPEAAAFAEDGSPKKPAEGFAKKLGLAVDELVIEQTDKGRYVAGRREEAGREAAEVLPELLSRLCQRIPFGKSMRWGAGEVAFGRPVHWLVCLHGEQLVPVSFAGVQAGDRSRGHRFLAPGSAALKSADGYVEAMRAVHVEVDPERRRARMLQALNAAAEAAGGSLVEDAFLIEENAAMVEEPHVVCGSFDPVFLELPEEVIVEVMRGHQRYFALRGPGGELLPRYLAVVNTDRAPDIISRGNDRVLRARLADARFFVEEDLERGLEGFVPELDSVVFQAKLGTVGERVVRLGRLAAALGDEGAGVEAARLCKADLATLIVGEFPELQGIMGRWYASKAGADDAVADAIRDHYLPGGAKDPVPEAPASARLAVADRADVLVGCFGVGLIPTGSADPFALRRAALGVVRVALEGPIDVDVRATLTAAHEAYEAQDKPVGPRDEVLASLDDFFRARLRALHADRVPTDVVDACLGAWDGGSVRDLAARLEALESFRRLPAYESLAVAFKRAYNIAKDAPSGGVDPQLLSEDAERALAERWSTVKSRTAEATEAGDYEGALSLVAEQLREPIDRFFDEVFVMVEDEALRDNRLRLLGEIASTLTAIAHFHLLGGAA